MKQTLLIVLKYQHNQVFLGVVLHFQNIFGGLFLFQYFDNFCFQSFHHLVLQSFLLLFFPDFGLQYIFLLLFHLFQNLITDYTGLLDNWIHLLKLPLFKTEVLVTVKVPVWYLLKVRNLDYHNTLDDDIKLIADVPIIH